MCAYINRKELTEIVTELINYSNRFGLFLPTYASHVNAMRDTHEYLFGMGRQWASCGRATLSTRASGPSRLQRKP